MTLKHIKELLQTSIGTEGSLLIPRKIYDTIIDEAEKNLVPRSEAAYFFGQSDIPGSSIDLDLLTPNSLDVREIAEGAEIWNDATAYTNLNLKPIKYGTAIRITREMLEDGKWNLLEHAARIAGRRLAENETSLIFTALTGAANTVAGGAAITITNINRARQYLLDSDYFPTTMLAGVEATTDISNIDTFAEWDKFGNREMQERGMVGMIYGMKLYTISTNAGWTSTTSFVLDREHAYAIAEKRAISLENFELPLYDMSGATVTQRLRVRLVRSSAVARITSS